MEESALPESIRNKALVTPGAHAWRLGDVEEVVVAAREVGLACVSGEVQFHFPEGICEAYWIGIDSAEWQAGELWQDYVSRSADDLLVKFRRLCRDTDFRKLAHEWDFVAEKMDHEGCEPLGYLWFELCFMAEPVLHAGNGSRGGKL